MNRTKTKKWVEAKVQNYDGGDWDSPEDSDNDSVGPEPPLQLGGGQDAKAPTYSPLPATTPAFAAETSASASDPVAHPPIQTAPAAPQEAEVVPDAAKSDDKHMSISPQLPNMARMSGFGFDMFPSDLNKDASNPRAAEHAIQEEREHLPGPASLASAGDANHGTQSGSASQLDAQSNLSPLPRVGEHDISSPSEQDEATSKDLAVSSSLGSQRISANEPPQGMALRIDSPPPQDPQQPASTTTPADTPVSIVPTEPLQPKKPEQSPSEYEPLSLQHTLTHDTATSSPVKENDVLSDEILRSLTPGSNAGALGSKLSESQTSLTTGSWERSGASSDISGSYEQHEAVAVPVLSIPAQQTNAPAPVQHHSPVPSSHEENDEDQRRRFSWEALAAAPAKPEVSATSTPQPAVQSPVGTSQTDERSPTSPHAGLPVNPISPTIKIVSESQPLDQQVTAFGPSESSIVQSQNQPELSGAQAPPSLNTNALSAAPHSSADGAMTSVASGLSSTNEKPTMPFKEIMGLSTAEGRIEKYEESRSSFATSESGLDEWITTMKNQHLEHANASGSFSGSVPPARTPSPSGSQPSAQQPYYQQYLNASNPNQSAPSTARSRLAGLQEHAHAAAGSAFGNSGNQIGNKGKEFMQSAGKMGKGLFSKGKSKLRGTGDKVFH